MDKRLFSSFFYRWWDMNLMIYYEFVTNFNGRNKMLRDVNF